MALALYKTHYSNEMRIDMVGRMEGAGAGWGGGGLTHKPIKDRLLNSCHLLLCVLKPAACRHLHLTPAYSESFLFRTQCKTELSARGVEHGLHKQRVMRTLLRAGVGGGGAKLRLHGYTETSV